MMIMMITVIAIVIVIVTIITVVRGKGLLHHRNLQCLPKAHLQEQPEVAIWPPKFSGAVDVSI